MQTCSLFPFFARRPQLVQMETLKTCAASAVVLKSAVPTYIQVMPVGTIQTTAECQDGVLLSDTLHRKEYMLLLPHSYMPSEFKKGGEELYKARQ